MSSIPGADSEVLDAGSPESSLRRWAMVGCGAGVSGWLLIVGFWVGIIVVVLWAVSRLFPVADHRRDAQDLLDHRLAAGEIDPDGYRQAREELAGAGAGPDKR